MRLTIMIAAAGLAALLATPAYSADPRAPVSGPPLNQPLLPSWTGFYVGAHAGYGFGDVDQRQTNGGMPPGPFSYDINGGVFGATLGFNYQIAPFLVVGVEGDLGYMGVSGEGRIPSSVPTRYQALNLDGGFYGDITARAGLALNSLLLYGKGGWAYYDAEASQTTTNPGYSTQPVKGFSGYVVGGGLEYMFTPNLTFKVEYLHYDFDAGEGSQTSVSDPPVGFVYRNETKFSVDTVKVGANYKF